MKRRCLQVPEVTLFAPMESRVDRSIISENSIQRIFQLEKGAVQCSQENHTKSSRYNSHSAQVFNTISSISLNGRRFYKVMSVRTSLSANKPSQSTLADAEKLS